MKKLLSDSEPPPRFIGEKEVSRKNKNLLQLIFSAKNERNRGKSAGINKSVDEQKKNSERKYSEEANYSSLEKYFSENKNQTATLKTLEFSEPTITANHDPALIAQDSDYFKKKEADLAPDKGAQKFYNVNSTYTFAEHKSFLENERDKMEIYRSESRKKEETEVIYILPPSEGEKKETEDGSIKFGSRAYN